MERLDVRTRFRNIATGQTSIWFEEVLPHKLTVDLGFVFSCWNWPRSKSLFQEIEIAPWDEHLTSRVQNLLRLPAASPCENRNTAMDTIAESLIDCLVDGWAKDKFHVVYVSAGWDSRLLVWTIGECYRRFGDDWLGDILFVTFEPDVSYVKRILMAQGWRDHQIYGYTKRDSRCLDFEQAYEGFNGPRNKAINWHYWPMVFLKEQGLIPKDTQVQKWHGIWGNRLGRIDSTENSIIHHYRDFYNCVITWCPQQYESLSIFDTIELWEIVRKSGLHYGRKTCYSRDKPYQREELRPSLVEHLDSDLAHWHTGIGAPSLDMAHYQLSNAQRGKIKHDYLKSWYGNSVHPEMADEVPKSILSNPFWSYWANAVICENLLQKGYQIS